MEIVKNNVKDCITCAIGDGANDVVMINEAHVGIGLQGAEGKQAARAADFAFGEFKFLKRLIFFYGRESYRKNANMILYSFWKNCLICVPQFWWGLSNYFSGQTIYEKFHFQLFNVFYTFFPILFYAIFDKEHPEGAFLSEHNLYSQGPKKELMNNKVFYRWFFGAF